MDLANWADGRQSLVQPLQSIHAIELTSRCNLKCSYCPSPVLPRPKLDMDRATFDDVLGLIERFIVAGTQDAEVNVTGIGESTLHPLLPEFLRDLRGVVGDECRIFMPTNGVNVPPELVEAIAPYRPEVHVSLHTTMAKVAPAIVQLKRHGLYARTATSVVDEPISWAGQVRWPDGAKVTPCPWILGAQCIVLSDGRLSHCCLDASGEGVFSTAYEALRALRSGFDVRMSTSKLCRTCHHSLDVPGFDKAQSANIALDMNPQLKTPLRFDGRGEGGAS